MGVPARVGWDAAMHPWVPLPGTCAPVWEGIQAPNDLGIGAFGSPHRNPEPMDGAFLETLGTPKCAAFPPMPLLQSHGVLSLSPKSSQKWM